MQFLTPILILSGVALVAGGGLTLAAAFLGEKVDPIIEKIRDELPGANCGVCGYAGCDDYAKAVAGGEDYHLCRLGKDKVRHALAKIVTENPLP